MDKIKRWIAKICYRIYVSWSGEFDGEYERPKWLKYPFKDINRGTYSWWNNEG